MGEICRFLVNQPPSALDRQHTIRLAFGNGMRRNVWEDFNQRFGIKCVEFYAGIYERNAKINSNPLLIFLKFILSV